MAGDTIKPNHISLYMIRFLHKSAVKRLKYKKNPYPELTSCDVTPLRALFFRTLIPPTNIRSGGSYAGPGQTSQPTTPRLHLRWNATGLPHPISVFLLNNCIRTPLISRPTLSPSNDSRSPPKSPNSEPEQRKQ
jgi:hypothetical protein